MTTHLASWGKINFQRNKSKAPDSPGNRGSPRKSPARSVSGVPADLSEKLVNNNYSQHSRQQTVAGLLTADQQNAFYQNHSGKKRSSSLGTTR
jgi:cell division protein FtsN